MNEKVIKLLEHIVLNDGTCDHSIGCNSCPLYNGCAGCYPKLIVEEAKDILIRSSIEEFLNNNG